MRWSYETYLSQPAWFIEGINYVDNLNARYQEEESKKHSRQMRITKGNPSTANKPFRR